MKKSEHSSFAVVLAAAVQEVFPEARFSAGGPTRWGFYGDFAFPFQFQEKFLTLIEERMRQILKAKPTFAVREMAAKSAEALLGHSVVGKLVQVVDMSGKMVLYPHSVAKECTGCFKLIFSGNRIVGIVAETKEELKKFLKSWKGVQRSPQLEEWFLETERGWVWKPEGEVIRQRLISLWKERLLNFKLVSTPSSDEVELVQNHLALGGQTAEIAYVACEEGPEGLLTPGRGFVDIVCSMEEDFLISSLQLIEKFLKMFSFEYEVVLTGSKVGPLAKALFHCHIEAEREEGGDNGIEFRLYDAIGRAWTGPYVKCTFVQGKRFVAIRSLFSSMERFAALLAEKGLF